MIKKVLNFLNKNKIFLVIFLLGMVLRFSGLSWGYPYIFHPDEDTLIRGATGIRFDPNPHHFDWPTLQTYLMFAVVAVWAKFTDILQSVGARPFLEKIFPLWFDRPFVFYLLARFISALLGSLSVGLIYVLAKKIFNKNSIALLSCAIVALSLQNIEDAHFATLDSSLTFWMLLSFYFAIRVYETGRLKYYLLSGFIAGIATSTKYNGAAIFAVTCLYHLLLSLKEKTPFIKIVLSKKLWLSFLALLFGFFLGTPYALLDFRTFIRTDSPNGALWQFTRQTGSTFMQRYLNFGLIENRFRTFSFRSIGAIWSLVALWGLGLALFSKFKKEYVPLLFFTIFYLWFVGQFPTFLSQYFNPFFPFLAMFAGFGFFALWSSAVRLKKGILIVAFLFGFCLPAQAGLFGSFNLVRVFSTKDNRLQARDYIIKNAPVGTWVALAGADKIELDEYNPKDNFGYNIKMLGSLINKIGRHESEGTIKRELVDTYKIRYVVVGDYGLQDILSTPFVAGCETFTVQRWADENLRKVAEFKPRFYNEPWVVVYKID